MTDLKPPYLTKEDIEDEIAQTHYFRFPGTSVTVCLLEFKNGACVLGKSMCINPENFDAQKGAVFAREDAVRKAFPMLAYAVFEAMRLKPILPRIYNEPTITPDNVHDIKWIDGGCDLEEAVQTLAGAS